MDTLTDVLRIETRYGDVKQYYGQILQKSSDLKTDACCTSEPLADHIREALLLINDEIKDKYYGCGSPIPLCLESLKILDLGCGTGRDCYVMSKLVGPNGLVHGLDMTENQIATAIKYVDQQTAAFGYDKPNVKFTFDYMENLREHFEQESLDVVTSNCAINLTMDKEVILQQVYEALKFGGEMFFSDVYADRRVPEDIRNDPVLRGECLGGALYCKDFERIAWKVGFTNPRVFSSRPIGIGNEQIKKMVGNVRFFSVTYRLWKLEGLEGACEDYGHVATYRGQILQSSSEFRLDGGHVFCRNKPERVCGNTALMLSETRLRKFFEVTGGFDEHFGVFKDCSTAEQNTETNPGNSGCC